MINMNVNQMDTRISIVRTTSRQVVAQDLELNFCNSRCCVWNRPVFRVRLVPASLTVYMWTMMTRSFGPASELPSCLAPQVLGMPGCYVSGGRPDEQDLQRYLQTTSWSAACCKCHGHPLCPPGWSGERVGDDESAAPQIDLA